MNDSVLRTSTFALQFTKAHVCSSTPWSGIGDFPRKLEGGYPYTGVNIPALWSQMADSSSPAIFGSVAQWGNANQKIAKGSKGLGFIFMKSYKNNDKEALDLKTQGEELEVSENGRILVPSASFTAFSQSQTDSYNSGDHHPILEVLKRQQMNDEMLNDCRVKALHEAEIYMDKWMLSDNAKIRTMSEGERSLIIHLAADLVVGFNAGSMAVAGEIHGSYPSIARDAAIALIGRQIMRPWGIACEILKQLSPVFDENVKAGIEAAKIKQEEFKNKGKTPSIDQFSALIKENIKAESSSAICVESLKIESVNHNTQTQLASELVEYSSNW